METGLGILQGSSIVFISLVDSREIEVRDVPVLLEFTRPIDVFDGLIGVAEIVDKGTDLQIDSGVGGVKRSRL